MKLVQTTLFGVRTVLEVWPKPNNFGCDAARISGVSGWVAQAALTRTPADGRSGEADGCLLALAGMIGMLIAVGLVTCRPRVTVEWIKEYPDPVCERCGKVLDGTSAACPARILMARMVEVYEVSFDFHVFVFVEHADAAAFAGLLCRGLASSAAANPANPRARITLSPVEPRLRRVFVPVSEGACIVHFGRRLKAAGPQTLNGRRV